ncbi:UDP-2,3-diacylglucosamine diphosphatase [Myroides phaeus]|uniref:UDP-2,3-diacylglucosamine hydrolase n=1 Tax=Myroides phaeus TaxID=702745 RepID=A0A1G8E4K3_9FLAO|nr:UDP-2,3-diacylglucosamine diphosphatase [Myroides phaeus]MEC4115646.1 UDP-2,3-diacylglucosamine diphosphatase [Myroides phaeus]SDH64775.1 UDP-2,3-diacylglucosamine hydrolase [Myroides phaeus]
MNFTINTNKSIYFASDQHFGAPTREKSFPREQLFLQWLKEKEEDMGALFILGDLFDFWFEYKTVVPKGFVRILGKLAELKDKGIPIFFFVGNHDLWMDDYFQTELGIPVFHESQTFEINGKSLFIAHGDGLGPGDMGYKRMKKVFTNKFSKWLFRWLHPDIGVKLGSYLSVKNKLISGDEDIKFLGEDKEWLILYAKRKLETQHFDYFVFGHRHLPMIINLNEKSKYINLGDWIGYFTYGKLDTEFHLIEYKKELQSR